MALETLEDIAEEMADLAGIYGTGPEHGDHPDECSCRMCFVGVLMDRMKDAAIREKALERAGLR